MSVVLPPSPLPGTSAPDCAKDVLTNRISACMRRFSVAELDEECSPSLRHELNNRNENERKGHLMFTEDDPKMQTQRFRVLEAGI